MTTFIYNNSKWRVIQGEWPEKPAQINYWGGFNLEDLSESIDNNKEYEQAIEVALSSAIDVRDEDQLELSHLVWRETTDKETQWQWHPQENVPYRLEVEVEIKERLANIMSENPFAKTKVAVMNKKLPGPVCVGYCKWCKALVPFDIGPVKDKNYRCKKKPLCKVAIPSPESGQHEETQEELWDLKKTLTNVCQVFDGWHQDGTAWSSYDEEVRQQVAKHLRKLYE